MEIQIQVLSIMKYFVCRFFYLVLFFIGYQGLSSAQSAEMLSLQNRIYNLNNQFKYDSSEIILNNYLQKPELTNEDGFYINLYLSYTYKRLFDYPSVEKYLNRALAFGEKTTNKNIFIAKINSQKAFVYFDIHEYEKSDSLMKLLEKSNFRDINDDNKSKLIMQQAYLLFLKKQFSAAETLYNKAILLMTSSSPCDLPMIYAKKIQLYGAMHLENEMLLAFNKSIASADSCGIIKYRMYSLEMMYLTYKLNNDNKKALEYFEKYDTVRMQYNETEHLKNLNLLDVKFQTEQKEKEIVQHKETITNNKLWLTGLGLSVLTLLFISTLIIFYYRKKEITKNLETKAQFTKQLLVTIEEERNRIAADLHDAVSHELLNLKSPEKKENNKELNNKIDSIINDIRIISRNLHPVMFHKVGLQNTIEQMVERVQTQNNFMLTAAINYSKCLPVESEIQIYRILQEAISNIIKYANSVAGKITILETDKNVLIEIKDNGKGFNVNDALATGKAFGLLNITERSKVIGGEATITSNSKGTTINIQIPKN